MSPISTSPDRVTDSYDCPLRALEQLLREAQRVGDAGVRGWASLAMLDAIDFAEEVGMVWDDEAERRRAAVREAFGDVNRGVVLNGSSCKRQCYRPAANPLGPHPMTLSLRTGYLA